MKLEVKVTKEHIVHGYQLSVVSCPVANAIRDAIYANKLKPGHLIVDGNTVCIQNNKYTLPDNAVFFIGKFDTEKQVEPFEFELEIDDVEK